MANIVPFTGGKRCIECDEQIDPRRLRVSPNARLCRPCQSQRDAAMAKAVNQLDHIGRGRPTVQQRGTITIRW